MRHIKSLFFIYLTHALTHRDAAYYPVAALIELGMEAGLAEDEGYAARRLGPVDK